MKKNTSLAITTVLVLIMTTVCFAYNSSVLDEQTRQDLDKVVSQLDSLSDYTIHLSGHTDNTGSEDRNKQLSKERVIAVKNYLVSKNVDSTKIILAFYGESKPVIANTSEENKALNRRVEITISGEKMNLPIVDTMLSEAEEMNLPQKEALATALETEEVNIPKDAVSKQKKVRRRLVWTGWRTGFHWSTSRR
jgi:hypothetical protein